MDVGAYARGLIELIQSSAAGTPRNMSDVITPVVDIEKYLGLNFRTAQALNIPAVAAGLSATFLEVPAGEFWIVRAGSVLVDHIAAATVLDAALLWYPAGGTVRSVLATEVFSMTGAGAETNGRPWLWPGVVMSPGDKVYLFVRAITGANGVADIRLVVDRLN